MNSSLFDFQNPELVSKPPLQQCSVSRSTLYLGDCFDAFKYVDDESIDAIIADLPYGTTACKWDSVLPFDKLWCEYERIIKPNGAIVLTASQPFTSALVMSNPKLFKYQWVWVKTKKTGFTNGKNRPLSQHEDVLVFSKANVANGSKIMMKYNPQGLQPLGKVRKGDKNKSVGDTNGQKYYRPSQSKDYIQEFTNYPTTILNVASEGKIMHPTQKPVELMEYLIRTYTDENDTVLDNTMGSGTTGLACLKTNRQFIGIEKEKKYYDVAVRRLSEYCGITVECCRSGGFIAQKPIKTTIAEHSTNVHKSRSAPILATLC